MASLPKPLIALLVATVAVFALWTAVLKKTVTGGGSSSSSSPSTPALQSAISKAHQAVATSNAASVAHGGTVSTTPAPAKNANAAPNPAQSSSAPAHAASSAKATQNAVATLKALAKSQPAKVTSVKAVLNAISAHKVVALLFFNPAAADDQAVKSELAGVPTRGNQVVKFSVPVTDISQYQPVTARVPVNASPTLMVIDRRGQTSTLFGFVDGLNISQQIAHALAAK